MNQKQYVLHCTSTVVKARYFAEPEIIKERAIYRRKGMPGIYYKRDYPDPGDDKFFIAKFNSIPDAIKVRNLVVDPFTFDVHEWSDGQLGPKIIYVDTATFNCNAEDN